MTPTPPMPAPDARPDTAPAAISDAAPAAPRSSRSGARPGPRRLVAAAVALLALAAPAGRAAPPPAGLDPGAARAADLWSAATLRDDVRFDLYFGGVRAGDLRLTMGFGDGAYIARSAASTAGIVGLFYAASYKATARGADPGLERGTALRPRRFSAKGSFGGKKQRLSIEFGLAAPRKVKSDPPFKKKPYEIDPAAQVGALDPLSAAAALLRPAPLAEICARDVDVFDGRRRSRISLDPPRARNGEILCRARFTRVAGYRPRDLDAQDIPFRLYFAELPNGGARLRRIEVDTEWGRAVALRRN